MRAEDAALFIVGQLIGRAIQEGSELLPTGALVKRILRAGIGIGEVVAAVTQERRISPEVEKLLGVSGSKIIADELVDFVLEMFAKPATPKASLTVPVKVESKVERAPARVKATLW